MATTTQKNTIVRMRDGGMTFAAIAEELNLSANTVQSVYRRAVAAGEEKADPKPKCENCRRPMKPTIQAARRFCCDDCRAKWWSKHPEQRPGKKAVCVQCGKSFSYQGSRPRKYCSRKCYGHSKVKAVAL
jgi:transposase-like protein